MEIVTPFSLTAMLLLVGVAHGFYLSIITVLQGRHLMANKLFATILFSYSYSLLIAYLATTGQIEQFKFLLGTGMPFLMLIGPLFYFYVCFVLGEKQKFQWPDLIHLTPAIALILLAMPYYLMPSNEKIIYVGDAASSIPIQRAWYIGFQLLLTIAYFIYTYKLINSKRKKDLSWKWLKNTQIALLVLITIYGITSPTLFLFSTYAEEIRAFFWVSISIFIHFIGYLVLKESFIFKKVGHGKLGNSNMSNERLSTIKLQILKYMKEHEPFLKSDFSLKDLSQGIQSNSYYTSTVINQCFEQSFSDFVNTHRIAKAEELLREKDIKLFAVALEAGFANKNSFNRVFKKVKGTTPSEFRKIIR